MALPTTLDPVNPEQSDPFSEIDDQIRALKQFLVDWFGVQTTMTAPAFSITADGDVTVAATTFTTKGIVSTLGTITDDRPVLNGTVTWNDGSDTFNGIKANVTDTNSAAASRLLALQVGGSDKFVVTKAGAVTTGEWAKVAVGSQYGGTGINTSTQLGGSGTGAFKVDAGTWSVVTPTNGQLLIGSTGVAPVLATLSQATGQLPTITNAAGAITIGGVTNYVRKTADETISGTTTLQDDNELTFLSDGSRYLVDLYLLVETGGSGMDFKCGWSTAGINLGTDIDFGLFEPNTALSTETSPLTINCDSGLHAFHIRGIEQGSGLHGVQFQWAQNAVSGSNLTVKAGSTLYYTKLS